MTEISFYERKTLSYPFQAVFCAAITRPLKYELFLMQNKSKSPLYMHIRVHMFICTTSNENNYRVYYRVFLLFFLYIAFFCFAGLSNLFFIFHLHLLFFIFLSSSFFFYWILIGLDQKCVEMELSLGLQEGKLQSTWSSLSGGKDGNEQKMRGEEVRREELRREMKNRDVSRDEGRSKED